MDGASSNGLVPMVRMAIGCCLPSLCTCIHSYLITLGVDGSTSADNDEQAVASLAWSASMRFNISDRSNGSFDCSNTSSMEERSSLGFLIGCIADVL
mmetsp:Transcript_17901/g.51309  ORF Transcript_17901/g.51309 Transcript_17901/m.51309 type:complete len:97 (+) Transcript_17901:4057-4347(+)